VLGEGLEHTALVVRPITGRRHQIRVHLAWIGHPIVGDPRFGGVEGERTRLHAWRLGFEGPDGRVECRADPEPDFFDPVGAVELPT
jgi:tRNA pseudouridine32 synthase/23S rRNA pseudouridine746 synthase/23S rRNA pseudouridine1911/1915/1917 synthase